MRFILNEKIDIQKWNSFCFGNTYSSPFQTHAFFEYINKLKGFTAEAVAVTDQANNLQSIAIIVIHQEKGLKKYFSKRGVIYGGPLISDKKYGAQLIKYLESYLKRKVIFLEARNFFDYSNFQEVYSNWTYSKHLNVQINIKNAKNVDDYLNTLKYNRRREIKKSIENGATFSICENRKDAYKIYEILKELYTKRVKLPLPPASFFEEMINTDCFVVFKVEHEGKIIGGSFCPYIKGKRIYTMYYCGIRDYDKKIFPTHLAILAAIEFGLKNDIQIIDLMGAGKPEDEYGVRKYKEQFGGDTVEHGRYLLVLKPFMYRLGKFGLKVLNKFL